MSSTTRNQPLLLGHARVDANRREVALDKEFVQLNRPLHRFDKDDDLVELERVQQVVELSVLLCLGQVDVVLLQAVQGELGLIVDVDFNGLLEGWTSTKSGEGRSL